jgi:hypothetical protein
LATAYLTWLHLVFRSHLEFVAELPSAAFMTVMRTLTDALDSLDADLAGSAASALDHLATFYVRNAKKEGPVFRSLRAHIAANPAIFETLMKILFQILVFGEAANQWALARPLLALILAAELVRPDVCAIPCLFRNTSRVTLCLTAVRRCLNSSKQRWCNHSLLMCSRR